MCADLYHYVELML